MDKFQEIRPYQDDEVQAVLESLLRDAEMLDSIARFYAPNFSRVPFRSANIREINVKKAAARRR